MLYNQPTLEIQQFKENHSKPKITTETSDRCVCLT